MLILKNSEKYSVFKIKKKNKNLILKISNRGPEKISREVKHIEKLKNSSDFFKKKIPSIIQYGKIKKGINKHKGFYTMPFIKGPTLSDLFQKNILSKTKRIKFFNYLSNSLIQEVRTAKLSKRKKSFNLYKNLFNNEYEKIADKPLFQDLLNRKFILINNKTHLNISFCLKKIFKSKKVKSMIKKYKYNCSLNHWNFHGGNIIFPQNKINDFKIIDPDSSWKINDPFFSLARLIYTYPHDTMEYDKYYLISRDFDKKNKKKPISFSIKQIWDKKIKKNYKMIFDNFFTKFDKKNLYFQRLSELEFLRFNLSLILCFLRGINANHQPKINFLTNNSHRFQNKGLYIYLFFLTYLNRFTETIIND